MKSQRIEEATIFAQIECAMKKTTIDLYEVPGGYAWKLKSLRNSTNFVKQFSHENGQVIVRSSNGKVIDTIGEKSKKKAAKKEQPDTDSFY